MELRVFLKQAFIQRKVYIYYYFLCYFDTFFLTYFYTQAMDLLTFSKQRQEINFQHKRLFIKTAHLFYCQKKKLYPYTLYQSVYQVPLVASVTHDWACVTALAWVASGLQQSLPATLRTPAASGQCRGWAAHPKLNYHAWNHCVLSTELSIPAGSIIKWLIPVWPI